MDYRNLGRSGLKVSPLCLGTMMFGGATDEPTAQRIIAKAREAGVNFIDTADAYNGGRSEEVTGRAISNQRDQWVLATKLANPMGEGPNAGGLSRKWIMRAVDASLRRLGTDYIDIYYLHKEDLNTPLAETVYAMGDLVRAARSAISACRTTRAGALRKSAPLRPAWHRPPGGEPALLQRHEPHARGRASAGLRLLRTRRRSLQSARARRPDREVCARCRAAARHPRRPQGPAHAAGRMAPGIAAPRAGDQAARRGAGA